MAINPGEILEKVRKTKPLVHSITNYVTVNDCANMLIACGGSPIMADDINEVSEITSICCALNMNIGTLNHQTIPSMIAAGKKSNELGHPVIFDPDGVGASQYRTEAAKTIMRDVKISAIRGNISEIKSLKTGGNTRGVDAYMGDEVTDGNLDGIIEFAKSFAREIDGVIVITGRIDIVTDGMRAFIVKNGHEMLSKISGTGCMLSAMLGAFLGADRKNPLESCVAAVCTMGLCGELAYEKLLKGEGNLAYKIKLFDEVFNMTCEKLNEGAKYEIR